MEKNYKTLLKDILKVKINENYIMFMNWKTHIIINLYIQ